MCHCIEWGVKFSLITPALYRVKRGQTLSDIARTFSIPPKILAAENGLTEEVREGQVLALPKCGRNLYVVRGGESKSLLCGSKENYESRNATKCFYPTQIIVL